VQLRLRKETSTADKSHEQSDTHPFASNTPMADLKEPTPGKISRFALSISCGSLTYIATIHTIFPKKRKHMISRITTSGIHHLAHGTLQKTPPHFTIVSYSMDEEKNLANFEAK